MNSPRPNNLQPQMLFHRHKILIIMEQSHIILNAVRTDQHINRLPHCNPLLPQRPIIHRRSNRIGTTAQCNEIKGLEKFLRFSEISIIAEPL